MNATIFNDAIQLIVKHYNVNILAINVNILSIRVISNNLQNECRQIEMRKLFSDQIINTN